MAHVILISGHFDLVEPPVDKTHAVDVNNVKPVGTAVILPYAALGIFQLLFIPIENLSFSLSI